MKKFDKYYVKKDPATGQVLSKDNKPILGDVAKSDCPLEDRQVRILNKDWKQSGVYFKEVESDQDEQSEARLALEIEAKELNISFRSNIGDDKLLEKINEAKINEAKIKE